MRKLRSWTFLSIGFLVLWFLLQQIFQFSSGVPDTTIFLSFFCALIISALINKIYLQREELSTLHEESQIARNMNEKFVETQEKLVSLQEKQILLHEKNRKKEIKPFLVFEGIDWTEGNKSVLVKIKILFNPLIINNVSFDGNDGLRCVDSSKVLGNLYSANDEFELAITNSKDSSDLTIRIHFEDIDGNNYSQVIELKEGETSVINLGLLSDNDIVTAPRGENLNIDTIQGEAVKPSPEVDQFKTDLPPGPKGWRRFFKKKHDITNYVTDDCFACRYSRPVLISWVSILVTGFLVLIIMLLFEVFDNLNQITYKDRPIAETVVIYSILLPFAMHKFIQQLRYEKPVLILNRSGIASIEFNFLNWADIMKIEIKVRVHSGSVLRLTMNDEKSSVKECKIGYLNASITKLKRQLAKYSNMRSETKRILEIHKALVDKVIGS